VRLKQQPGKHITVPGSPRLVRSLLELGLLDELTLSICPIVVGRGHRLVEDMRSRLALEVVRSVALRTGAINVTYRPVDAHHASPDVSVAAFPAQERSVMVWRRRARWQARRGT
jgi:dihydrofolate reductase